MTARAFIVLFVTGLVFSIGCSKPNDQSASAPPGNDELTEAETRRVRVATPQGEETKEITYYKNSIGMEFVKIEPGEFLMGSPANEGGRSDDEKQHEVAIRKGFYLGATEVTQDQWRAVMGNNPSYFTGDGRLPVEQVSWLDAQEFCKKLSDSDTEGGRTYRLPTEAEWEYACRAGTTGPYAGKLEDMAWYSQNSGSKTHPVATKQANAWGLYDMHGNVWEWCQSAYEGYPYDADDGRNAYNDHVNRVCRGGCWDIDPWSCRSADRVGPSPAYRYDIFGFRVCLD